MWRVHKLDEKLYFWARVITEAELTEREYRILARKLACSINLLLSRACI